MTYCIQYTCVLYILTHYADQQHNHIIYKHKYRKGKTTGMSGKCYFKWYVRYVKLLYRYLRSFINVRINIHFYISI